VRFPGANPRLAPLLENHRQSVERRQQESARFGQELAPSLERARQALRLQVRDPRVREATLWQSRAALAALDALADDGQPTRNRKVRQREQLAAMYLQRYRAKNDSISFFGPRAWGSVAAAPAPLTAIPERSLLDRRDLYFEHWAIWKLAERITLDPPMRPHVRPLRSPRVAVEGVRLHHSVDQWTELPPAFARLLLFCDGTATVEELCRRLVGSAPDQFPTQEECLAALDELEESHLITRGLWVPTCDYHPELALRAELERMPAPIAASWLRVLDELEQHRDRLRAAEGPVARAQALEALERRFSELTASPAERGAGQMYAARSIVFEDCTRKLTFDLGQSLLRRIAQPLELALLSGRWYMAEIEAQLNARAHQILGELGHVSGGATNYLRFWIALEPSVEEIVASARTRLQEHWRSVVGEVGDARRLDLDAARLAAPLHERLQRRAASWPSARFLSPDLMIAASSVESAERGEYTVVLGEVHVGINTVCYPVSVKQAAEAPAIANAFTADCPRLLVTPSISNERYHRAIRFDLSGRHIIELETSPGTVSRFSPEQRIDIGELYVTDASGELLVKTQDGRFSAPLATVIDGPLRTGRDLKLFAGPHVPRITIDGLVVQRESWQSAAPVFDPDDEPLLAVAAWARRLGIPRYCFVKFVEETKPFLLDRENPFLAETFVRLAKQSVGLSVSEMLPAPDQLWLCDAQGARYTSEVRVVILDTVAKEVGDHAQLGRIAAPLIA
jgi:hypothetical protein